MSRYGHFTIKILKYLHFSIYDFLRYYFLRYVFLIYAFFKNVFFKISIGNLKTPKKNLEQFNGLGNWGFICGGTGWAEVGEPLWAYNRALSLVS